MEVFSQTASKPRKVRVNATFNVNLAPRDLPVAPDEDFFIAAEDWERFRPALEEGLNQMLAGLDMVLPAGSTIDLGEVHVELEEAD